MFEGGLLETLEPVLGDLGLSHALTFNGVRNHTYQFAVGTRTDKVTYAEPASFAFRIEQTTTMVSPLATNVVTEGMPVQLAATTTERPEDIVEGRFVDGAQVLFSTAVPPFSLTWTNAAPGSHSISFELLLRSGEIITNILTRRLRIGPRNNEFSSPALVEGTEGEIRPQFAGTDDSRGLASLWFRWSAPEDGFFFIESPNRQPSGLDAQLSIGNDPKQLTLLKPLGLLSIAGWIAFPVTGGANYNLRITGSAQFTNARLAFKFLRPPENDAFSTPVPLEGSALRMTSVTLAATAEVGEPDHGFEPPRRTLWWTWTAPAHGILYLQTRASVALYEGDSLAGLRKIPAVWFDGLKMVVERGIQYRLALDDATSSTPDVKWELHFTPFPTNDHFANRLPLKGRRTVFRSAIALATEESGEPRPEGFNNGHTVWWTWSAPTAGPVVLRPAEGSEFGRIAVFRSESLSELKVVAVDVGTVRFNANAGEVFQISVDRFNSGEPVLELLLETSPENDQFAQRRALTENQSPAASWNFGTDREFLEPLHTGTYGGRSVWYSWRSPHAGATRVEIAGDIPATLVAVYTGTAVEALREVASASGSTNVSLEFPAEPDKEYAIAVDGAFGATGDFSIAIGMSAPVGPLRLTLQIDASGKIRVRISGLAMRSVTLELSHDLVEWSPVGMSIDGSDEAEFMQPISDSIFTSRYYDSRFSAGKVIS